MAVDIVGSASQSHNKAKQCVELTIPSIDKFVSMFKSVCIKVLSTSNVNHLALSHCDSEFLDWHEMQRLLPHGVSERSYGNLQSHKLLNGIKLQSTSVYVPELG